MREIGRNSKLGAEIKRAKQRAAGGGGESFRLQCVGGGGCTSVVGIQF